jgi:hypothetical protein
MAAARPSRNEARYSHPIELAESAGIVVATETAMPMTSIHLGLHRSATIPSGTVESRNTTEKVENRTASWNASAPKP